MPTPNGYHQETNAQHRVRKYEVFPGRNRFCCGGRLITSTQLGIFYLTLTLIVATSICFFALDAAYLWVELKLYPLPLIAALLMVFVVSVLCRTALSDPGIIPRATPAEAAALEKLIEEENCSTPSSNGLPHRPPPRIREVTVNGMPFKLKYCYTCKIFRPPRASHCSVCDNCVDRFDHHCPWVGNCVGRRNYKYFFLFLTSLTVYCAYLMALSITCIVFRTKNMGSFIAAMQSGPLSPIVALVAFFSIWSVAGLGGFHTHLIAMGITTNEDIKGTFKKSRGGNPFSAGSRCANCLTVICGPVPPSIIDSRGWVTNDDVDPPQSSQPNRRFGGYGTKLLPINSAAHQNTTDSSSFTTTVSSRGSNGQHNTEIYPLADGKVNDRAVVQPQSGGVFIAYPPKLPPLENRSTIQIDLESGSNTHSSHRELQNVFPASYIPQDTV